MSEHTPLTPDPEYHSPGAPPEGTDNRDELQEVRDPWRVKASQMYGFWRPAVLLMILGVLALVISRVIF